MAAFVGACEGPGLASAARWTGRLFRVAFPVALDDAHLVAAARHVALNPARAAGCACVGPGMVERAAHLAGRDDALVRVAPLVIP
jgi:hypothetical protein